MLTFEEYERVINESVDPRKITINQNNYTVGRIKSEFKKRGYKFYGYIETSHKQYNNFDFIDFCHAIPKDILDLAVKYYNTYENLVKDTYLRWRPNMSDADINTYYEDDNIDSKDIKEIMHADKREKVNMAFNEKKTKKFFVLFNEEEKYFYFLCPSKYEPEHQAFVDLYIKIRVNGRETVKKELEERGAIINADVQAKYLAWEIKYKEQEEKRKLEEAEKAEMQRRSEELKAYVKDNEDKFILLKRGQKIPDDFEKYAEYCEYIDDDHYIGNPYGEYAVMCYVCNKDYTQFYKYKAEVSNRRSGMWTDD